MIDHHPTPDDLERFILGELSPSEMRDVARHLLNGCPECQEATACLWEPEDVFEDPCVLDLAGAEDHAGDEYDGVLDRVFAKLAATEVVVAEQRLAGQRLLGELMQVPQARRQLLLTNSNRFRSHALCGLLIAESHEGGFQVPQQAIEVAQLGVLLADRLIPDDCGGDDALNSMRARAWGQLGNAFRVSFRAEEAEEAFRVAESVLATGHAGLLDRAHVLSLLASLRKMQRRFGEALQIFDRVAAIYKKVGQWNLLGRTFLKKSMVCGEAGDGEAEMILLRRALDLIDPQTDPRVFLAARHNLIHALHENGRSREAFALLFHTRPLYLKMGDRMNLLKLRWLEGLVALGLDRHDQAEAAFLEVREAFQSLGVGYDAALASLDLAGLYVVQGRPADVRRVAEETLVLFQAHNNRREALAALLVLCSAARLDHAGLELVRKVSEFLRRARNDLDLHFSPNS